MKRQELYLGLFLAVCMAQIAVPASMIVRHERTLSRGEEFRFHCEPVDPADPLRGRYVDLGFEESTLTVDASERFWPGRRLYVRIEADADGFARLTEPTTERPDSGPYLTVGTLWQNDDQLTIQLPFNRYYMEEKLAPEAERAYREQVWDGESGAHVTVRVLDGHAALEELYLGGVPVRQALEPGP